MRLEIVRDGDGRAVALEGTLDGGWTDDDVLSHMAVADEKADACGGCGHPMSESTDPDNQFAYEAEAVRCHACKTRATTVDQFEPDQRDGLLVRSWLEDG